MPGVVVEPDGVGFDLSVQLPGAQLDGQGDTAVLQRDDQVIVLVAWFRIKGRRIKSVLPQNRKQSENIQYKSIIE